MPLIKCIDCGRNVSTHALACPFCGCPIEAILTETAEGKNAAQPAQPEKKPASEASSNSTPPPQENMSAEALIAPIVAPIVVPAKEEAAPAKNNESENPKKESFVAVLCPSCGSKEINFISTDYGVCLHCGSKVKLNNSEEHTVKAEIHIHSEKAQSNASFYGIKKTLTPTAFYRDAVLDLVRDEGTPADLFEATFEPAVASNKHIGVFSGNVSGTYTAEVGYDKVQEIREWSPIQQRYVTREGKQTEWEPFSGNYDRTHETVCDIIGDPLDEGIESAFVYSSSFYDLEKDREESDDIVAPTQEVIQSAMNDCTELAKERAKESLPGEHSRNYSFSGHATLDHYVCYTIPTYSLPFTYQGKKYKKSFFATRQHNKAAFGYTPNVSDDMQADTDQKMRPLGIVSLVLMSLSIFCGLLFCVIREQVLRGVSLGVTIPVFLLSVTSTVLYFILRKKYYTSITETNLLAKIKGANRILREKGLKPIWEKEKNDLLGRGE